MVPLAVTPVTPAMEGRLLWFSWLNETNLICEVPALIKTTLFKGVICIRTHARTPSHIYSVKDCVRE